MAPKNLLKNMFQNVIKKKSRDSMPSPVKSDASEGDKTITTDRPTTLLLERTNSWVEQHATLGVINEASVSSGNSTLDDKMEQDKSWDPAEVVIAQREHIDCIRQFNETMTTFHLDTIESTLLLIQVLEQMSPHVGPLRETMLKRKAWCEKHLKELQKIRAKGE